MAAMEWDEPGMKRNKNVRFRMGQGSNTVSYYPPQSALEVGRNPSVYNSNQLPAVRQGGLPTVTSRGALPSVVPPQTGFQMGAGSPVEVSPVSRPTTPQLQIGYDGPKERISLNQVRQNLNKGKFVGPPAPEGYTAPQSQTTLPNEGFVGPKNTGAFAPRTTFGGSHVVDPSGALAGELYRRLSKSTGRYIPGLEQMWGGQPNADEWKQGTNEAYQQARSGLKVHPMNTQYKNHGMSATGFPSITAEQRAAIVGRQDVPQQGEKAQDIVYGKTPGSAIIKDYPTGNVLAQGSGAATGGFARNEESRLKDVAAEEARVNNFWADAAKQRAMETTDKQNSMMTQLNSAIRSGDQEQAAMLTNALKGVGAIQPLNYGTNENQLAEAQARLAAIPYIGPKAKAEIAWHEGQGQYYGGRNEVDLGSARAKAAADVLAAKLRQSGKGALDPKARIDLENMAMTNPEGYAKLVKEFGIAG